MSEAPAASNTDMLIWLAGGAGSDEDRTANQKQWQKWCENHLSPADLKRMKKTKKKKTATTSDRPGRFRKNTAVQTAEALRVSPHRFRLYTDGGCDGNGARGKRGAAGWGVHVQDISEECACCGARCRWCICALDAAEEPAAGGDDTPAALAQSAATFDRGDVGCVSSWADLWGPVVTNVESD